LPSARPSAATEPLVMMETTFTPGAISKVTSEFTAPYTSSVTFPFSTLRALILMGPIVSDSPAPYQPNCHHIVWAKEDTLSPRFKPPGAARSGTPLQIGQRLPYSSWRSHQGPTS
jgi:hypothetical protein